MNSSWEYQQQLIGDQASLDYILSCSNRPNHNTDLNSILTRTANITKVNKKKRKRKENCFFAFIRFHLNYMKHIFKKKNV
jgi:glucan biosynthesis protein